MPHLPPLVLALLAFLAGLLPALRFSLPTLPALLAGAVVLTAAAYLRHTAAASALLLLASFAGAGAALGAIRSAAPDCRDAIPDRVGLEAVGYLGAGVFPATDGGASPLLPLEGVRIASFGQRCEVALRAILPDHAPAARAGARVHLRGQWIRSGMRPESGWPADPYRAGYFRADTVLSVSPARLSEAPLLTLRGWFEQHLRSLFPGHFPLVEALLLGRRERVDSEVLDRFTRSGLSHLLAISGSHVALLAGVLLIVGGALRMPRRRITRFTIVITCGYLLVIGAPASAVRAGAMVSLVLLTALLQRPSAMLPVATAACLFIVALDPLAVLDVGLQLSFAGVFGIIVAQRHLGRRIARAPGGPPVRWLLETLAISTAAFVATAPITALQFGSVAPIAILANVPAIPLTGLALVGILAACVAAPVAPLADLVAAGTGLSLDLLDRVATAAAAIPYGSLTVDRPDPLQWSAAATAAILLALAARAARPIVRAGAATMTLSAVVLAWPVVVNRASGGLEIHFIDVGQGDAVALRTPAGRWVLVDAGPRGRDYDAGERRVVPFFRARGVNRLDLFVLTHPDADHIGGAPAVIREMRVARVMEPGVEVGKELYLEMLDEVEREKAGWIPARRGQTLSLDGVTLRILWPDSLAATRTEAANDASAVIHLRYGEFTLLLPGDAGSEVEAALLREDGGALQATVLKAGHHGSSTSTSADFLRAVDPELAVISAGRGNRYGHPAPDVLGRLSSEGVEIARTDEEGTVSLRVSDGAVNTWTRIGH